MVCGDISLVTRTSQEAGRKWVFTHRILSFNDNQTVRFFSLSPGCVHTSPFRTFAVIAAIMDDDAELPSSSGPLGGLGQDLFSTIWHSFKKDDKRALLAVDKATRSGGCSLIDSATIELTGPAWQRCMEQHAHLTTTSLPSVTLKRLTVDARKENAPVPSFVIPAFLYSSRSRLGNLQELCLLKSNVSLTPAL